MARAHDAATRYINRELSWLDFNARVLDLAADESVPLLERIKFCAIFSSNLDEFFMVRVAGLEGQASAGIPVRSADGRSPQQALAAIRERVSELVARQARLWSRQLRPALEEEGIRVGSVEDCNAKELTELTTRFERPDVVVLDLMLPGLDGWQVLETARAEGIGTPILVVSARGTEHDHDLAALLDRRAASRRLVRHRLVFGLYRLIPRPEEPLHHLVTSFSPRVNPRPLLEHDHASRWPRC